MILSIACLIRSINEAAADSGSQWRFIGFFDDGKAKGARNEYGEVLGNMADLNQWPTDLAVVIAVGSPKALNAISNKITNPKISFPNLVAPDVKWLDRQNVTLGKGNIFCPRCLVSCNVHIGDFNILRQLAVGELQYAAAVWRVCRPRRSYNKA